MMRKLRSKEEAVNWLVEACKREVVGSSANESKA